MYGGWYEGTIRSTSPDLAGKWGVYLMPSASADGPRAANLGGSSLAITSASAEQGSRLGLSQLHARNQ